MTEHHRPVAVLGATGKTGRAVLAALARRHVGARPLSRTTPHPVDLDTGVGLEAGLAGCRAVYVAAPNVHPDEPALVGRVLEAARRTGVGTVVLHSVLHPYVPAMPHHVGKAAAEDLVRRSGLRWSVLQPCAYAQNLVLAAASGELVVPYDVDAPFSLVDLDDVGEAAARLLVDDTLRFGTYEACGPRRVSAADVAAATGVPVRRTSVEDWLAGPGAALPPYARGALAAMFRYYDTHGLVGSPAVLELLLGRPPTDRLEPVHR